MTSRVSAGTWISRRTVVMGAALAVVAAGAVVLTNGTARAATTDTNAWYQDNRNSGNALNQQGQLVKVGATDPTTPPTGAGKAPTVTYPLGTTVVQFNRGARSLPTKNWYPRSGTGTNEVVDAAVTTGRFPLVLFSHGLTGQPDTYADQIRPLAAAGFIVAAPWYPNTKTGSKLDMNDVFSGAQSLDASTVITGVLAYDTTAGNRFYQHFDRTRGVGAAGHSAGAMTTQGLLGFKKDTRVTAVVMLAVVSIGSPSGSSVNTLFINGDQDKTTTYAAARSAYNAVPWPKAFLTHVGGSHDSYVWRSGVGYHQTSKSLVDWFRWSLYGDSAAKGRLAADATASTTRWESSGL